MEGFVTDTMAVILWLEKRKMPQNANAIFTKAERKEVKLYIPAMVLVEIGYLSEKKRIEITLQEATSYVNNHSILHHPMDTELIKSAFETDDIPELHDRLIAATGRVLNYPVITNDPMIIASKFVSTVWE